jgi:hypothetical protein
VRRGYCARDLQQEIDNLFDRKNTLLACSRCPVGNNRLCGRAGDELHGKERLFAYRLSVFEDSHDSIVVESAQQLVLLHETGASYIACCPLGQE